MKKISSYLCKTLLMVALSTFHGAIAIASEKPVQHLKVADITSYQEAKRVFTETTSQIKSKTKLNAEELHQIHMITYSLEKAIAYFGGNMKGEQQAAANKIAQVVELVHIGSENNRTEETKIYLEEYFQLAEKFALNFK